MSQDIADMPGIEAAMERFNVMDPNGAADAARTSTTKTNSNADTATATRSEKPDAGAAAEARPDGPGPDGVAQNSDTTNSDTRAAADAANGKDTNQQRDANGRFINGEKGKDQSLLTSSPTDKTDANDKGGPGASRYAKAQERLEKTWEGVNKRKSELDGQAAALEQQRLTIEREKAQFEAIRRQAEQPQATPEQALQASQRRRQEADALRMQARRAEQSGEIDKAQKLDKQADKAESMADELNEYAEQLKKNPPVSMQQRQQQFEQARKQWTVEAVNAFPELGKNGSRLQQVVAQHLNALSKQDPELLVHPSLIYHIARLSDSQIKAADLQAVAARVPVLEKESEKLRARIKELEASVTPSGDGGVARLGGEPKDDYTSLRQAAAEIGHGRW